MMISDIEQQQINGDLDVAKLISQRKHSKILEKKFGKMITQLL